jgi:hypothetical protein
MPIRLLHSIGPWTLDPCLKSPLVKFTIWPIKSRTVDKQKWDEKWGYWEEHENHIGHIWQSVWDEIGNTLET